MPHDEARGATRQCKPGTSFHPWLTVSIGKARRLRKTRTKGRVGTSTGRLPGPRASARTGFGVGRTRGLSTRGLHGSGAGADAAGSRVTEAQELSLHRPVHALDPEQLSSRPILEFRARREVALAVHVGETAWKHHHDFKRDSGRKWTNCQDLSCNENLGLGPSIEHRRS